MLCHFLLLHWMFAASIQMSIEKYFPRLKKARVEDEDQPEPEVSVWNRAQQSDQCN